MSSDGNINTKSQNEASVSERRKISDKEYPSAEQLIRLRCVMIPMLIYSYVCIP